MVPPSNYGTRWVNGENKQFFTFQLWIPTIDSNVADTRWLPYRTVNDYLKETFSGSPSCAGSIHGYDYTRRLGTPLKAVGIDVCIIDGAGDSKGIADHVLALFAEAGKRIENRVDATPKRLQSPGLPQTFAELETGLRDAVYPTFAPEIVATRAYSGYALPMLPAKTAAAGAFVP